MADVPLFAEKYELVRRIAIGGMGEIYLALETRESGHQRQVVVKRILRNMAQDPMFVTMFTDEARVSEHLDHENIIRVHEIGQAEGIYYIAMEYLDGRDLSQVMARAIKLGRSIGLANAIQVVRDVAAGAHYAHIKCDDNGVPLGIVHRDLSPRNIMVTWDGQAKILDFGLAKAKTQVNVTLPGKIKGTPSYLAPEQLDGKPVSPSTDIFAMGTLLFELTTLRRLFRRGTTIDTMRAVKACQVPKPSTLVRRYPPAIETVVLRALARHPDDRYATSDELRNALDQLLESLGIENNPEQLGLTIRELFDQPTSITVPKLPNPDGSATSTQADEIAPRFPIEASSILLDRSNLPVHKNSFIGRAATLTKIAKAVDSGKRLLTMTGPPGTGKTRLAIEFARARVDHYRDHGGTWLCEVENISTMVDLCGLIGGVINAPLTSGGDTKDLLEELGCALKGRGRTMIVLDNVDRIVDQLDDPLVQLIKAAPETVFLLTTRELLRIDDETPIDVAPLGLPRPGKKPDSEAVTLFTERARQVNPAFKPTDEDLASAARIVQRLDGIPLAIELAAARLSEMSINALLGQLLRRFDVLATPQKGAAKPKETLVEAIDWSWNLLAPWEKSALAQASVFHGGFDMEAADAVIDLSAYPDAPWVIDVLQNLRNKSLVRSYEAAEFVGEPRCQQYVSIRSYARRKLEIAGMLNAALERHAQHYLRVGSHWSVGGGQRAGVEGRKRLALELPNLLATHRRLISKKPLTVERVAKAMEAALALEPVLTIRGPFAAYLRLLDDTLAPHHSALVDAPLRAKVLLTRGHVHRIHGNMSDAKTDLRGVLEIARTSKDKSIGGRGLTEMGTLRMVMGQHLPASDMLRRALGMHKAVGDVEWQAKTLLAMGNVCMMRGEIEKARACFEAAIPRFQAVGESVLEGACLGNLGTLEQAQGHLDQAREYLEQAVAKHQEVGATRFEGYALTCLGSVSHEQGALELASGFYRSGLKVLREAGDRRWEGVVLGYSGLLLHELGRFKYARKRLHRALELLRDTGDMRMAGFLHGALAAVASAMGDLKVAEYQLDRAKDMAKKTDSQLLDHAVDVYRGFVDIAESMEAPSRAGASLLRDTARDRLVRAMVRMDPDDDGVQSDLADLYRLSVRLLRHTVEAVDAAEASNPNG